MFLLLASRSSRVRPCGRLATQTAFKCDPGPSGLYAVTPEDPACAGNPVPPGAVTHWSTHSHRQCDVTARTQVINLTWYQCWDWRERQSVDSSSAYPRWRRGVNSFSCTGRDGRQQPLTHARSVCRSRLKQKLLHELKDWRSDRSAAAPPSVDGSSSV